MRFILTCCRATYLLRGTNRKWINALLNVPRSSESQHAQRFRMLVARMHRNTRIAGLRKVGPGLGDGSKGAKTIKLSVASRSSRE
jgi:hypothetical protein